MDFSLTADQQNIRDAILKHCSQFPDEYWLERDREGVFPHDFFKSMVEAGWLGIAMPTEFGGSGLGITEASVMMQAIAESGAGMGGASSVHIPVFSLQPIAQFGTQKQKERILPPVIAGKDQVCFAVTEPNVGLNTTELKTRAERRDGGYLVNGEKIWISTAQVANKMLLLARTTPLNEVKRKTDGLSMFYTSLDRAAITRAARYARERIVFNRPIGMNQGIQHPLAKCWAQVEAANLMVMKAATLFDQGKDCGVEANAAKYLAGEFAFEACHTAMLTLGGMGYAQEYHVERYLRESLIPRTAPVSPHMILNFLAEKVLGLPKSY